MVDVERAADAASRLHDRRRVRGWVAELGGSIPAAPARRRGTSLKWIAKLESTRRDVSPSDLCLGGCVVLVVVVNIEVRREASAADTDR